MIIILDQNIKKKDVGYRFSLFVDTSYGGNQNRIESIFLYGNLNYTSRILLRLASLPTNLILLNYLIFSIKETFFFQNRPELLIYI